ncbi:hypothetical protein AALP_AAs43110U000100, partial [Arabis alpina]
MDVASPNV